MNEPSNELPPNAPTDQDSQGKPKRRVHSSQFKSAMIAQCLAGDQSLASIALANNLNSTMLRKWVREHQRSGGARFVPVKAERQVPRPASSPAGMIEVTLSGGRVCVHGQVDPQALHAVLMALR